MLDSQKKKTGIMLTIGTVISMILFVLVSHPNGKHMLAKDFALVLSVLFNLEAYNSVYFFRERIIIGLLLEANRKDNQVARLAKFYLEQLRHETKKFNEKYKDDESTLTLPEMYEFLTDQEIVQEIYLIDKYLEELREEKEYLNDILDDIKKS